VSRSLGEFCPHGFRTSATLSNFVERRRFYIGMSLSYPF
jgi:hypothetical protein